MSKEETPLTLGYWAEELIGVRSLRADGNFILWIAMTDRCVKRAAYASYGWPEELEKGIFSSARKKYRVVELEN